MKKIQNTAKSDHLHESRVHTSSNKKSGHANNTHKVQDVHSARHEHSGHNVRKVQNVHKRVFFMILYAVLLGYGFYQIFFVQQANLMQLRKQQQTLTENIEKENEKNAQLTQDLQEGNTDSIVEKIAREKLGLVKPDEKMYIDKSRAEN